MMHGHHNGKLHAVGQYQRDWYAHILWTVYKVCVEFLDQRLSEADLLAGACLANPFTSFNHEITCLPPTKTQVAQLASETQFRHG